MHNDYPIKVAGITVRSSEALYQALRFPDNPDWQEDILDAPHAMRAKMASKKEQRRANHTRSDWLDIRELVMEYCLTLKLQQHPETYGYLQELQHRPIVEKSKKDNFWGAIEKSPHTLYGQNKLGKLLMKIRDNGFSNNLKIPSLILLEEELKI
jgi:ribA/ribD-fused uncharacterized protein